MANLSAHLPLIVGLWLAAAVLLGAIGGLIARYVALPLLLAHRQAQAAPPAALARLERRLDRLEVRLATADESAPSEPWRG